DVANLDRQGDRLLVLLLSVECANAGLELVRLGEALPLGGRQLGQDIEMSEGTASVGGQPVLVALELNEELQRLLPRLARRRPVRRGFSVQPQESEGASQRSAAWPRPGVGAVVELLVKRQSLAVVLDGLGGTANGRNAQVVPHQGATRMR